LNFTKGRVNYQNEFVIEAQKRGKGNCGRSLLQKPIPKRKGSWKAVGGPCRVSRIRGWLVKKQTRGVYYGRVITRCLGSSVLNKKKEKKFDGKGGRGRNKKLRELPTMGGRKKLFVKLVGNYIR